jgi:hypothetical protein
MSLVFESSDVSLNGYKNQGDQIFREQIAQYPPKMIQNDVKPILHQIL